MPAIFTSPYKNILETIGHTPTVRLDRLIPTAPFNLFAKLESFNPGGSIKDRTALRIIARALEAGELKSGDTVIESSSGNMAIGLAQVCLFYGLKLVVVVDPKINPQNIRILEAYGALVDQINPAPGTDYLTARLQRVSRLLEENPHSFWPNQYANPNNPDAHWSTMDEILTSLDGNLDYLFISTSTCGTLMGCVEYLNKVNSHTKVIAVDAVGSVIFGTPTGERLIPGHGSGRPSKFLDSQDIHDIIHISDEDCVTGCRQLLDLESIFCGGSSGGVVSAVNQYKGKIENGSNCVMILCDRGERYLDTIYNDEWITRNFHQHEVVSAD